MFGVFLFLVICIAGFGDNWNFSAFPLFNATDNETTPEPLLWGIIHARSSKTH